MLRRHLHCPDPRIVENYVRKYEKLAVECEFLPRLESLLSRVKYPLQKKLQEELEELDAIRCSMTYEAEKKVPQTLQRPGGVLARAPTSLPPIRVFSLLHKKLSGRKVSSRLIHRALNKADIPREALGFSKAHVESKLKVRYTAYYKVKKDNIANQQTYLEELALVLAEQQELGKATMLCQLKEREHQRSVTRKIRFLQGKLFKGSITMVTVDTPEGLQDITDKELMEQAIMNSNSAKFQQSHHRPF